MCLQVLSQMSGGIENWYITKSKCSERLLDQSNTIKI